ncbi:hypothetical protein DFH09DRAFT_1328195 [Mycena vulgaris]|nr:hypothetical protein DFH09DRAFT_1328195 [Mycena vulgaris]
MAKKKNDNTESTRCRWTDADDAAMVAALRKGKDDGFQADSRWKPQVWAFVVDALEDSPDPPKTSSKCQDHWGKSLKNSFNSIRAVREASGFGWDNGLKMATATESVWDPYLTRDPNAARWRNTPFPLYDEILYLVDGIVATGAGAFHPSARVASQTQTDTEDSQVPSGGSMGLGSQSQVLETPPCCSPRRIPARNIMTPDNDDLIGSSPIKPCKRGASSSPSTTKKKRPCNADAATSVAAALERVAASLNVVGSPEVCERVIHMMEDDGDFSDNEQAEVMALFAENSGVAKAYVSSRKKATRTTFARRMLTAAENAV